MYAAELKAIVKGCGIPQWKIAECMGVSEATIYRKLRGNAEVTADFERQILLAITAIKMEKGDK